MSDRRLDTGIIDHTAAINMKALAEQVLDLSVAHLKDPRNWCRGADFIMSDDPTRPNQRCARGTIDFFSGQIASRHGVSSLDLRSRAIWACRKFLLRRGLVLFGVPAVNDYLGRKAAIWMLTGAKAHA
jgi:hypothetical protein